MNFYFKRQLDGMNRRKDLTPKQKQLLLTKQNNRCANNPHNPAINMGLYKCNLWINNNGLFDSSGYQVDHIDEFSITHDNNITNLQLLCPACHNYKTKVWTRDGKKYGFTSRELERGVAMMDTD